MTFPRGTTKGYAFYFYIAKETKARIGSAVIARISILVLYVVLVLAPVL